MTAGAGAGPLLLWAAVMVCAAMGLRGRRATSAAPARAPSPVPALLLAAARVPGTAALGRALARTDDERHVARAGLTAALPRAALARMRAGSAVALASLGIALALLSPTAVMVAPVLAGLGVAAPGRWLARRGAARARAIVRELPDLLDLLGICVESGMALDPALRLAGERLGGTLGVEVGVVLRDLSLGTPRREAYHALVGRVDAPELTRMVGALLQAEELGAPLSRALSGQADALRAGRRQDARERAARAAPKIQLVVAMVMVPAVLLLVIGVLVMELARQVGAVVG